MFATPSGQLLSPDYSWTLGDLTPDTEYLLQARVVFDQGTTDLQGGLHEVRTPPQPTRECSLLWSSDWLKSVPVVREARIDLEHISFRCDFLIFILV